MIMLRECPGIHIKTSQEYSVYKQEYIIKHHMLLCECISWNTEKQKKEKMK